MSQEKLYTKITSMLKESNEFPSDNICVTIKPRFVSGDFDKRQITVAFPVQKWQLNPLGALHGGMLATMFDTAFGILVNALGDYGHAPTVSLSTTYTNFAKLGDEILITAVEISKGNTITNVEGKAFVKGKSGYIGTAVSTYMVPRPWKGAVDAGKPTV